MNYYVAQISKAQILEDNNKSNNVEVDGVNNSDLSPDWRQAAQSTATG